MNSSKSALVLAALTLLTKSYCYKTKQNKTKQKQTNKQTNKKEKKKKKKIYWNNK